MAKKRALIITMGIFWGIIGFFFVLFWFFVFPPLGIIAFIGLLCLTIAVVKELKKAK